MNAPTIIQKVRKGEKLKKTNWFFIAILTFLTIYSIIMIGILVWALFTSLKTYPMFRKDCLGLPKGLPWEWNWQAYVDAFEHFKVSKGTGKGDAYLAEMFAYSFIYSIGCAFTATFVPMLTAYTTSKFDLKFSRIIYSTVIVTMAIPIVGALPAQIQMSKNLGIFNTMHGAWIRQGSFLGMYYLVFFSYFKGVAKEYSEAACVDGAGEFRIFFQIIFPIARNMFFTVMLIKFIGYWNDYQTPLIFLRSYPPVAVGLYRYALSADNATSWPTMKVTGSILMAVPTLILFMFFHDKIIGNITIGGVKE